MDVEVRFRWPLQVRLRWCADCNVPLIQEECELCNSKGFEIRLSPPGDVRPAFKGDVEVIKAALLNEFGDLSLTRELSLEEGLPLVNKVPHYDDMKEVIIGGVVVGRYFFDPMKFRWRWRLSKYSAEVAVSKGLVKAITTDRVRPLEVLTTTDDEEDTQYVLVSNNSEPIGIAVARNGRVRVQTVFSRASSPEVSTRKSTLKDFNRANDLRLRTLISRGIKRLHVMSSKVGLPLTISYSGGKDSLVALDLAVKAGLEPAIVFNNTGLELPETVDNVAQIVKHYGLKYYEAKPDKEFWEALSVFGPPAKDFRWCCKLIKLIPLAKLYKTLFPNGALNIIGQRGMESIDRALSGNVWRNKWIPHILNITPIQEWPQLAVWSYILSNDLIYNPLYECGFDRLGCYLCPAANVAEHHTLSKTHPGLWSLWEEHLIKWSKELKLPEVWVKYALWRWLDPSSSGRKRVEIKCLGKKHVSNWIDEYEARVGIKVLDKHITATKARVTFNTSIPQEGLTEQASSLGKVHIQRNDLGVEVKTSDYLIRVIGNNLEVSVNNVVKTNALELTISAVKLMVRWMKCINCGACTLWCSNKAIKLENHKPKINESKCVSCGICLEVCPINEVLIDKALMPLLVNNLNTPKTKRRSKTVALSKSLRLSHIRQNTNSESGDGVELPQHLFMN
ncbi:MAG: phosphoadenosine phosphosulfate reductase family protein [Sulfolobales archaeon]|nr:phosphoadenosine phosphosulfate reductase family protein [Sulfolobales archaeon]